MRGVFNNLKKLKPIIEVLYDDKIFDISHFADDAPFFGWVGDERNKK